MSDEEAKWKVITFEIEGQEWRDIECTFVEPIEGANKYDKPRGLRFYGEEDFPLAEFFGPVNFWREDRSAKPSALTTPTPTAPELLRNQPEGEGIPAGFTKWEGGEWNGDPAAKVETIVKRDLVNYPINKAGKLPADAWRNYIEFYRIIDTPTDQVRNDSQHVGEDGGEGSNEDLLDIRWEIIGEEGSHGPDADGWYVIDTSQFTRIRIDRDTEFKCSDGNIRQRRIDGEVGFLIADVSSYTWGVGGADKQLHYSFTHWRPWTPQLDWAPYYGLTPPTHHGYRLETSIRESDGQNVYRYVPTDRFIPHEPDTMAVSDMSREQLEEAFGSVGLRLDVAKKPEEVI